MPGLKIFFHDNCFDGAASAALFAEFYRAARRPGVEIGLEGVQHRSGDPFAGRRVDGEENACVDFRYSPDPRMTWWFDHHVSAFQPPALRDHFAARRGDQLVYDPAARSCAILIADSLRDRFGFDVRARDGAWSELIAWADKIDAARFDDAAEAVELAAPALRVMTWLEHNRDPALTDRLIRLLGTRPVAAIAEEPWIAEPLGPILERHRGHVDLVRGRAIASGGVVSYDLSMDDVWVHNKFIAYMLFPGCRYTVGVARSADRVKISVGSNPWSPVPRTHDIAAMCERYGGGGHPVVGAVSLPAAELDRAREIAAEISEQLRRE